MNKIIAVKESFGCKGCMFDRVYTICDTDTECYQTIEGIRFNCAEDHVIYKREKDMNEMPELKAGMIVEYTSKEYGVLGLYLYINDDWGLGLSPNSKQNLSSGVSVSKIFNINGDDSTNYNSLGSNLNLIWSKKSDKDIKIEEIQGKMDELRKEMEELKG